MIVTNGDSPLRILLLGPPVVLWNGAPVDFQGRLTKALLFYLASHGSQVQQDQLAYLLWGSIPTAQRRLREHLARLQTLLPLPEILRGESGLVGIDSSLVYVDQLEFQNQIDRAGHYPWRNLPHQPLDEATASLLAGAAGLWRGSRYLEGVNLPISSGLAAWYEQTRQNLETLYQRVLKRLAEHSYASGAFEATRQYSRLALVYNEVDEDLHYKALSSLIQEGKRGEARRYFNQVQKLFREKLDSAPSTRLVNLYSQVRSEEPARKRASKRFISTPRWPLHDTLSTPFIGQERVLAALQRRYLEGGGVFIFGESGQGKTRLLQEFTRQAKPVPRLLLAFSRPAENNLPFQPMIEVLRYQILPDEWLSLPPVWAGHIAHLLPELAEMHQEQNQLAQVELSIDAAPELARAALMEAIRQLFLHIASRQPLLFCLDDAQWTDEATLETLAYLVARPPFDRQALLLVTARSGEKNPALEKILTTLPQANNFSVVHLEAFKQEEIDTLCQYVFERTPGPEFLAKIARETGGNPLYLLEIFRAIQAHDPSVEFEQLTSLPVTTSLQTLIRARLQQLSPLAREVLEMAAAIGVEFSTGVLMEASKKSSQEIMAALEELVQRLLVEVVSVSLPDIRYRFNHNTIRDTLLAGLSPLRLRWLHSQVASILEDQMRNQASSQAALLAEHFELAGELSKAFDYWVRAVRRARQLFALDAARAACQRAEALIPHAPILANEQIHSLYAEWVEMAYENEDAPALWRLGNAMLELGREFESPLLTGAGLNCLCSACMVQNRFQDGLNYASQAIACLEKEEWVYELVAAYIHLGVFSYMLNRMEDSIAALQDALALGTTSNDPRVIRARAEAHYQISLARTLSGSPELGQNHAHHALADFARLDRAHGQAAAYSALALANYYLGNYSQACQDSQSGLDVAERLQAGRLLGNLHGSRSMLEMVTGNPDRALEHARITVELGERYGHDEILASGRRFMGDVFLGFGAYRQALEHYKFSFELSKGRFLTTDQQFRMGLCMSRTGQVQAGFEQIQEAIRNSQKAGMLVFTVMAELCLCYVYPLLNEWDQARQTAVQVLKETTRRKLLTTRMKAELLMGQIALREGNISNATSHFKLVVQEAARQPSPFLELEAHIKLYAISCQAEHPNQENHDRAVALLDQISANSRDPDLKPGVEAFKHLCEKLLGG